MEPPEYKCFEASQGIELAKISNDRLAAAIKRHPTRYAGLAAVAPQDPQAAALEVERAMQSLSLNGVLINSHTNDEFLDDQKFWPIFEAAGGERCTNLYSSTPAPSANGRCI